MAKNGPIIILEDDTEDVEVLEEAFRRIGVENERKYFGDGQEIVQYLQTTADKPLLVLSGVKICGMNGLDLSRRIQSDEALRKKSIPFIYFTLDTRREVVDEAYSLSVQGYFPKAFTTEAVERQLRLILTYWMGCEHPSGE